MSKWSTAFWVDLGERVVATLIGAVITMLTADTSGVISGSPQQWWLIVGLPTVLALLKGLLANLSDAESGASAVPSPPAPELVEPYEGQHRRDEIGSARLPFVGASRDRSLPGKARVRARRGNRAPE